MWILQIVAALACVVLYFVVMCYAISKGQRKFRLWINGGSEFLGLSRKSVFEIGVPALVTLAGLGLAAKSANLEAAEKLFDKFPFLLGLNLFFPVLAVPLLLLMKDLSSPASATETELMTLFDQLDEVVAQKSRRFSTAAVAAEKAVGNVHARTVFKEITRPEEQIGLLMDALYLYVSLTSRAKGLQVCLARMGDEHIEEIAYYRPHSKTPKDISSVQHEGSGFSIAKARGTIVVFPDLSRENEKHPYFADSRSMKSGPTGAMVCYPVEHGTTTETPYVISLYSEEKAFSAEEERKYDMILASFGIRIAMEHSLITLKDRAQ